MTRQRRPLVLTADPELLDQLLGTAAAAGVPVDVAVEPTTCRPQWTDAPLVLLGTDLASAPVVARLGQRASVLLVTQGAPPPELFDIMATIGAEDVVSLPGGEAGLLERLADATEPPTPARLIGVVGGRGGAGASVLATGLALTAARVAPSWLIDLDPLGGGADAGLGVELSPGARWSDLTGLTGRLSPHALRAALPEVDGVAVLAADGGSALDLTPEAVRAVVATASRGGGTVVLDLGRSQIAAREETVAAVDDLLLLVPAELRAVLAARRVVQALGPAPSPRVVVRTVPGALPSREVAAALDLSLAGELPDEVPVRAAVQTGDPAALLRGTALAALCEAILVVPPALGVAA